MTKSATKAPGAGKTTSKGSVPFPGAVQRVGNKLDWTAAHRAYLVAHYLPAAKPQMAHDLGCSPSALYKAAQVFGIIGGGDSRVGTSMSTGRRPWTAADVEYLRVNYPQETSKTQRQQAVVKIAKHLNRQIGAIYLKAHKLSLTRENHKTEPWTEEELALLASHYPILGAKGLIKHLQDRDIREIYDKAYHVGLTKRQRALSRAKRKAAERRRLTQETTAVAA